MRSDRSRFGRTDGEGLFQGIRDRSRIRASGSDGKAQGRGRGMGHADGMIQARVMGIFQHRVHMVMAMHMRRAGFGSMKEGGMRFDRNRSADHQQGQQCGQAYPSREHIPGFAHDSTGKREIGLCQGENQTSKFSLHSGILRLRSFRSRSFPQRSRADWKAARASSRRSSRTSRFARAAWYQ